jgi:protein SCO1/2
MSTPEPPTQSSAEPVHPSNWLRIALFTSLLVMFIATGVFVFAAYRPQTTPSPEPTAELQGTAIDPPRELSDFTLPSQNGTPLSLNSLRGKYVLLFFGYTHCPDVCPTTLADFVQVRRALSTAASQVKFVFVSVDGERDTPAVLSRFLQAFDPAFIGLQGDDTTLARIGKEYGLYYKKEQVANTSEPYLVTHSAASYLLDRNGRMIKIYSFGTSPKIIAADIGDLYAHE